jgi:hypothetical protein
LYSYLRSLWNGVHGRDIDEDLGERYTYNAHREDGRGCSSVLGHSSERFSIASQGELGMDKEGFIKRAWSRVALLLYRSLRSPLRRLCSTLSKLESSCTS